MVEALYGENPPPIMIIGHSMGGAIAVHTANANHIPSLLGLCVIDVVEGKCTFSNRCIIERYSLVYDTQMSK